MYVGNTAIHMYDNRELRRALLLHYTITCCEKCVSRALTSVSGAATLRPYGRQLLSRIFLNQR